MQDGLSLYLAWGSLVYVCRYEGFNTHTHTHITYLLNATSKPERDEWIEAIKQATPASKNSPNPVRKDVKVKPDPKRKEEKELQPPHPTYTQRQTTADEVALQASQEETESDKVLTNGRTT